MLLAAARRLEPLDAELARETYLDAWGAALFAGPMATEENLREVSIAARSVPRSPDTSRPSDLLLDGLATLITEGRQSAADRLRRATQAFVADGVSAKDNFRWGWLSTGAGECALGRRELHAIN